MAEIVEHGFAKALCAALLAAFIGTVHAPAATAGVVLITPEEAQLPTPKGVFASRAVTRGPRIDIASPVGSEIRSPLHLQLTFRGFGGATINLDSLRVTYMKVPNVDLTSRLKPYARSTGIDIPDAEAPPGEHLVRVEIYDSDGRRTTATLLLSVVP